MKKVPITYQMQNDKLIMPPVTWPARCPCCGSAEIVKTSKLEYKARVTSTRMGSTTNSTYYPLEWQVPFCNTCLMHIKRVENLSYIIVAACILLPIILSIVLGIVSKTFLILAVIAITIALGLVTYQLLLHFVIRPQMTRTCIHHRYPVFASDGANCIEFQFYNDEIADQFADLNNATATPTEKPNFWSLKRK